MELNIKFVKMFIENFEGRWEIWYNYDIYII